MKHHPLTACILAALLSLPLCSCARQTPSAPSPVTTPSLATTSPDATSPYDLISDYEALIAELRDALLHMKESDYITRAEYEARIHALEEELAAIQAPTETTHLPLWTAPAETSPIQEPTTEASTPKPPPTVTTLGRLS